MIKIRRNFKQFFTKYKCIVVIGLIALAISVSYMIYSYKISNLLCIESIYSFLNNLSISYIAALIFFIVQVYIPEKTNKKKSMQILNNQFVDLIEFVDSIILLTEKYFEIGTKGAKILWNDSTKILFLKYSKNNVPNFVIFSETDLIKKNDIFAEKLYKIKGLPIINYCDYNILRKLSEIEKNDFFQDLNQVVEYANSDITFNKFIAERNRMKTLLDEFRKLCNISKCNLSIEYMNDKEKELYIQIIKELQGSNKEIKLIETANKIMNQHES